MADRIGYTRVSTVDQGLALHLDAVPTAGCRRIQELILTRLAAALERGIVGGRPESVTQTRLEAAERRPANVESTGQVAESIGVGRAAVIRHLAKDEVSAVRAA